MNYHVLSHANVVVAADYFDPIVRAACDVKKHRYILESEQVTHQITYQNAYSYVFASYPYSSFSEYPYLVATARNYYSIDTIPTAEQLVFVADFISAQGSVLYNSILPDIEQIKGAIVDLYTQVSVGTTSELANALVDRLNYVGQRLTDTVDEVGTSDSYSGTIT